MKEHLGNLGINTLGGGGGWRCLPKHFKGFNMILHTKDIFQVLFKDCLVRCLKGKYNLKYYY